MTDYDDTQCLHLCWRCQGYVRLCISSSHHLTTFLDSLPHHAGLQKPKCSSLIVQASLPSMYAYPATFDHKKTPEARHQLFAANTRKGRCLLTQQPVRSNLICTRDTSLSATGAWHRCSISKIVVHHDFSPSAVQVNLCGFFVSLVASSSHILLWDVFCFEL